MKPFIRSIYNYDADAVSLDTGLKCEDHSLAKQSFAEEADINTIVRRFNLTGELPKDIRAPSYADFVEVVDFHSAMNAIVAANESFDSLPADVRLRFNNDPGSFVDFCSDEINLPDMVKMGLAVAIEPPLSASGVILDPTLPIPDAKV